MAFRMAMTVSRLGGKCSDGTSGGIICGGVDMWWF